jgi:coenzyme F420 hydrogenase subunit beta
MEKRKPTLRELIDDVVHGGSCSECGACVVACPYGVLNYDGHKPEAYPDRWSKGTTPGLAIGEELLRQNFCPISENVGCDVCASVCPKLELGKDQLELSMYGRTATEEERDGVGVVAEMYGVKTRDPRVMQKCQDGGFVTTLLLWALDMKRIDGAVVTQTSKVDPCKPIPAIATTRQEILDSAGSWYTYSPNTIALMEASERDLKQVAFVGTPCQITPIRKLQNQELLANELIDPGELNLLRQKNHVTNYVNRVAFTVGLLCSETFTYEGMMEGKIAKSLGIDLHQVAKFNIKGKVLVHMKSGEVKEFPLKEAFPYARPECSFCGDFSSEEADISAGGVGTNGWTLVLVRTAKGQQLFHDLLASGRIEVKPISEFEKPVSIMYKLAKKQRERREKALQGIVGH